MGDAMGGWYLPAEEYWVEPDAARDYPVRQGDLFGALDVAGERWEAALLVHPTCELPKKSVREVQIVRVRSLGSIPDVRQRAQVATGWVERERVTRVAFAHTFFLAPVHGEADPAFADFRAIACCEKEALLAAGRRGAMTHDARVTLIRRKLYFRYRIALSLEQVRKLEAKRIGVDPSFAGPRPAWAPATG
jgi:hypothetical protein